MKSTLSLEFVSCGCAKSPHCLDWGANNWIAFGSSYNVCLIRPEDQKTACQISNTFCCHSGNITAVKYVQGLHENDAYVVSGSADCSCVLWRQRDESLKPMAKLLGHSMAVNYVCGVFVDDVKKSILVATCSADSTLKIWTVDCSTDNYCEFNECLQSVSFGRGFALCVDFYRSQYDGILMAVGNDDNKIRLFHTDSVSKNFFQVLTLSGHEDWVRDLKFCKTADTDALLASCSQDNYVRLWRLKRDLDANIPDSNDQEIKVAGRIFSVKTNSKLNIANSEPISYEVTLDAVLSGHESWVYSVSWHPKGKQQLVTSSMDKTIIVWEPDPNVGIWFAKAHLGEVGGPVAGFYGAKFSPDGRRVVGHSFAGALHCWKLNDQDMWQPSVIPTGHFSDVEDIAWDPNGNYLMSCSQDQTTRLFAHWKRPNHVHTYHEIARPQVHGHDLQCLACVSSYCFVSGAEEKIVRAFVAPRTFAKNLSYISGLDQKCVEKYLPHDHLAEGASVPALGLSNKAIFADDITNPIERSNGDEASEKYPVFYFNPLELTEPPTEDYLAQNTLWPEVHKLYGHGFEIFSVASNHAGTVVASACKATKIEHAKIILWSTTDWQQKLQLEANSLTVTEIAFSPNDKYLLTVSRDRTWFLFARGEGDFNWTKVGYSDKKTCVHARIIWSCAWTHDSSYFLTVSRDKKLVVWKIENAPTIDDNQTLSTGIVSLAGKPLETEDSTTAIAVAHKSLSDNLYLFAIGLESGKLCLYTWHSTTLLFTQIETEIPGFEHALTVKRLRFKPLLNPFGKDDDRENDCEFHLASCSLDHSIKIFCVRFSK